MKIVLIHDGTDYEALLLTSLVIGLKKKYAGAKIVWAGRPDCFPLVKYNKRIKKCIDISSIDNLEGLTQFYKSDICINPYATQMAANFVSACVSDKTYGFDKNGPVDANAEFFDNVMYGDLKTNRTILDIYYGLADLKWQGEGYGLSYYPRKKQCKTVGIYLHDAVDQQLEGETITLPKKWFDRFDTINEYQKIITDDLFTLHASLSLRKEVLFCKTLRYNLNFAARSL